MEDSNSKFIPLSDKIQIAIAVLTGIAALLSGVAAYYAAKAALAAKDAVVAQVRVSLYQSASQIEKNEIDHPWLHALGWVPDNKTTNNQDAMNYFSGSLKALTGSPCPDLTDLKSLGRFLADNSGKKDTNILRCLQIASAHVNMMLDNTESAFLNRDILKNGEWETWLRACDLISPHPLFLYALQTGQYHEDFCDFMKNRLLEPADPDDTVDTKLVMDAYWPPKAPNPR